jgi:hypothetical protein
MLFPGSSPMASLAEFFRTELPPHGEDPKDCSRIPGPIEDQPLLLTHPKSNACAKLTARKTMNFSAKLRVVIGEPKVPMADSTAEMARIMHFRITALV